MASLSSSNTLVPPSWPSTDTGVANRDASFSSYLKNTEQTYIHTLVTTSQRPRARKVEDGEIDIFGAEKYFNGGVDKKSSTTTVKNRTDKAMISLSDLNLQPRTPSVHSESSTNSQTALLRRVQRNPSKSYLSHQGKKSSFLSGYCCYEKSVDVENVNQFSNHGKINKENAIERPITRTIKTSFDTAEITRLNKLRLDVVPVPLTVVKEIQIEDEDDEKIRRKKSLEVFGSDEGSKRFSLEKRLNMLCWDAIPRSVEEINTSARTSGAYKDNESDASSDLFEIECLSYTTNPARVQGTRNTSNESTTPSGYAPSEASIDWSVVTASAADFTTVSDLDDQSCTDFTQTQPTDVRTGLKSALPGKMMAKKCVQKSKGGGILAGCKSQKAVRVAECVDRSPVNRRSGENQRMQWFSDSYSPVTRFKSEAKLPVHGLRQSKAAATSDILYIY
ncbi:hypothetical protein vseg_002058 [Gypsophila vaccaria]